MSRAFVSLVALVVLLCPAWGRAQAYETVGIRAQGMAGAFVAVADDATASWWNPAGLAHGAYFSSILEFGSSRQPDADRDAAGRPAAAWKNRVRGFSASFPALALGYYRLRISQIQPLDPTAGAAAGRQDPGAGDVRLRSLALSQYGVTVGQSLGEHLVIGTTLKVLRGSAVLAVRRGAEATLVAADTLEGRGGTRADLDAGAMAVFGPARVGVTVKNVTTPAFGEGDERVELSRQVRAGLAVVAAAITVAVDADLTTEATVLGDDRQVAAGVEAWILSRRLGLRGGVSANTLSEARSSTSGGVSLALRSGTYLDGFVTVGSDASRQGWGFAIRTTY